MNQSNKKMRNIPLQLPLLRPLTLAIASLAIVAASASPFAMADDTGWYIGGNVGQSKAKIDDTKINNTLLGDGFTSDTINDSNHDTGYKLFGGYQFNPYFALEGGYYDLGKFGFTANTQPPATLNGNIKINGVDLDALGFIPFTEHFSAFGRIGMNYSNARDSFSGNAPINVPQPDPGKRALNYKLGVGLQYEFTDALAMRLEAERYRIDDAVGNKGDVDLVSVGLVYRFGQKSPSRPMPAPVPEPVVQTPAPAPIVAVVTPPPPPPQPAKVSFSADSLFDFNKSSVKPEGKQALDTFAGNLKGTDYSVISVTGHTDRIGSHAYNMKLSTHRAEAVKAYLVESAGIPADKIGAQGVDGLDPVTKPEDCKGNKPTKKLIACLQPDRRVDIEVSGTK
jgi:OOP family OmpA-OmpF porin